MHHHIRFTAAVHAVRSRMVTHSSSGAERGVPVTAGEDSPSQSSVRHGRLGVLRMQCRVGRPPEHLLRCGSFTANFDVLSHADLARARDATIRKGVTIHLSRTDRDLCPVAAMLGCLYRCSRSSAGSISRYLRGSWLKSAMLSRLETFKLTIIPGTVSKSVPPLRAPPWGCRSP